MEWTDRHYRFMMRLITKKTILYTEMVVDDTIIYQQHDLDTYLGFDACEHPIVLQVGGSDPEKGFSFSFSLSRITCVFLFTTILVATATKIGLQDYPYDEVNLNCGCPSDKVAGKGCFGARLMLGSLFLPLSTS